VIAVGLLLHRVLVGELIMSFLLDPTKVYEKYTSEKKRQAEQKNGEAYKPPDYGDWLGTLEVLIYAFSMLKYPQFIGIWLATKYIATMRGWQEGPAGRTFYNRSLIGSGLTVLFGVLTGTVAKSIAFP
jgi:hypothetical protein